MTPLRPIGSARDPSRYITDSIMFFNHRGFASGTPWPAAEFSGVRAYTPTVEVPKIVIIHFQFFQASARDLVHENVS
jgi:hypothetical protein